MRQYRARLTTNQTEALVVRIPDKDFEVTAPC